MALNINFDLKWIIIPIAIIIGLSVFNIRQCNNNEQLETYNRQLSGNLSAQEYKLQQANNKLGVSESELVTQQELAERLKKDKEEVDKEFEEFKEKHNLIIKSRDKTIASLKQKLKGGTTDVVVSEDEEGCGGIEDRCVISYNWADLYNRFQLTDPNIFEKDNEIFESEQIFKIYGEIYEEKDGSLQTRRLVLREVFKNENGEYKPIPDAKADIVASKFQYSNAPFIEKWKWQDLFRLRGIFIGGVEILPNSGNTVFGLGLEFFTYSGIGIGSYTMLDFQQPELISQHISLQYNPTIMNTELNLGVFVSIGTPFAEFFNKYQFNTGLVFYLNN
jgi:hypothetical protein